MRSAITMKGLPMRYKLNASGKKKVILFAVVVALLVLSAVLFVAFALPAFSQSLREADDEVKASLKSDHYESTGMKITYNEYSENGLYWFVADIELHNSGCLKTALASDKAGEYYMEDPLTLAERKSAILAIPGDRYSYCDTGVIIRNGELYRTEPSERSALLIYADGSMKSVPESSIPDEAAAKALIADGVVQSFSAGPALISGGDAVQGLSSYADGDKFMARSGIGRRADGHVIVIVADKVGGTSSGVTFGGLRKLFADEKCEEAYALCSGADAVMIYKGEAISRMEGRTTPRKVSDMIIFSEAKE